jgi:UDP-perosamine 4-acetyltransferase
MNPAILLGSGGHARVLLGTLRRLNIEIAGIADPVKRTGEMCYGVEVLGNDEMILNFDCNKIELVNGIGSLPGDAGVRAALFDRFRRLNFRFKTLIDPSSLINEEVSLSEGVQVMMGVIIQSGAQIAENCIVNSGAIVEHDCRIGRHVHIAPGAVLSGGVEVGDHVHIGTGATVIQGIKIGEGSVIGAGVVLTRNVGNDQIIYPPRPWIKQ